MATKIVSSSACKTNPYHDVGARVARATNEYKLTFNELTPEEQNVYALAAQLLLDAKASA
jgi:hypothetical protein